MSDTASTFMRSWIEAGEHGAALIYNRIQSIEADATKWTADHPAIAPLLAYAEQEATTLLTAAGVSVPAALNVGTMVMAGLQKIAALDPTVVVKAP